MVPHPNSACPGPRSLRAVCTTSDRHLGPPSLCIERTGSSVNVPHRSANAPAVCPSTRVGAIHYASTRTVHDGLRLGCIGILILTRRCRECRTDTFLAPTSPRCPRGHARRRAGTGACPARRNCIDEHQARLDARHDARKPALALYERQRAQILAPRWRAEPMRRSQCPHPGPRRQPRGISRSRVR